MIDFEKQIKDLHQMLEDLIAEETNINLDRPITETLLMHKNCPEYILRKYCSESNAAIIALNDNCPADLLIDIISNASNDITASYAIKNKNFPIEMLTNYSNHDVDYIKLAVIYNPHCPIDILKSMQNDENKEIRSEVGKKLAKKLNLESFK